MSLTCKDCLAIISQTFYTADTRTNGTVWIPDDVFDLDTAPKPYDGQEYEVKESWAYRWYDSGTWCMTENEWCGGFETAQDAFEAAYEMFGPQDDLEDVTPWKEYADDWNLDPSFVQ